MNIARISADTAPIMQELPSTAAFLSPQETAVTNLTVAPNVVGLLEGSDPKLKDQYVVIAAHMDNDSRSNSARAQDNAPGIAGLLAIVKAFSQPGMRPRCSVLFLSTSSGAQADRWGASSFVYGVTGFMGQLNLVADPTLARILNSVFSPWMAGR